MLTQRVLAVVPGAGDAAVSLGPGGKIAALAEDTITTGTFDLSTIGHAPDGKRKRQGCSL